MATNSVYTAKKQIIDVCKRIYDRGYVAANDGNVSVRVDNGHIVMTPTGRSKGFLTIDELVVVDIDGNKVSGSSKPSSESKMHLSIYKSRDNVNSVVHAHPPTATGYAVAGIPLNQCVLPEVVVTVGSIPIAEYATPGTQELADVVVKYFQTYDAILLENHGAITVGDSVINAHYKMETMEHFAKIMFVAHQLGNIQGLGGKDVEELMALRQRLGLTASIPACEITGACSTNTSGSAPQTNEPVSAELIENITRQVIAKLK